MAASADKTGSAPPPFPPLEEIIQEGSQEIGRQVRDAIERAVTSGIAVDLGRLRKWGPDGADYFAKELRDRIMPSSTGAVPPVASESSAVNLASAESGSALNDLVLAASAKPMSVPGQTAPAITTAKDWTHQEHSRWSIATRAIARSLLVALILLLLTLVTPRIWS